MTIAPLPTPGYCTACYEREWKTQEIGKIKHAFALLEANPHLLGALEYAERAMRFETMDHLKTHVPQVKDSAK